MPSGGSGLQAASANACVGTFRPGTIAPRLRAGGVPQAVWDAMPSPPQSAGASSLDLWVTPDDDVAEPIRAYYPEICLDDLTKLTEAFVFP